MAPSTSNRKPADLDPDLMMRRSRKDYVTYREWRERGETVFGAFLRTVPFQYVWAVLALLVILVVMYFNRGADIPLRIPWSHEDPKPSQQSP
jgi:hypothetical protein